MKTWKTSNDPKFDAKIRRPRALTHRKHNPPIVVSQTGKATPYGVNNLNHNGGWVRAGIEPDTTTFAVGAIQQWREVMARIACRHAISLLIATDWKIRSGLRGLLWSGNSSSSSIGGSSAHGGAFPPGTSK